MRAPRGFGLIETLAALAVLTAGLAATAGVLVQAVRLEAEAAALSQATRLGRDLAEGLRAIPRPDGGPPASISGTAADAACATLPVACPAELAGSQLRLAWLARVRQELGPEAEGQAEIPADNPVQVVVLVRRNARATTMRLVVAP